MEIDHPGDGLLADPAELALGAGNHDTVDHRTAKRFRCSAGFKSGETALENLYLDGLTAGCRNL